MRCRGLMFDRNRNWNAIGQPGMLLNNSVYLPGLGNNMELHFNYSPLSRDFQRGKCGRPLLVVAWREEGL